MKPRLALIPPPLHGFLKVSVTVGNPGVRLAAFNKEMPVLQIEDAGLVIEVEFTDERGLEEFARRVQALVKGRRSDNG